MSLPSLHRLAERELTEAATYYEGERRGLGGAFLTAAEGCVEEILAHPEAGRKIRGEVRRRLLRRFPYAVIYMVVPGGVRILACMSLKRRPFYWAGRA